MTARQTINHSPFVRKTLLLALSLFVCLIAVYSLTYSGTFVTDDEHILAARTISLAYDERINNERIIGNSRVFELSQLPPEAMNIEPAQTILGIPLLHLARIFDLGQVQTLFLMNIWATALSAVVLFFTILMFGYSTGAALVVSLFFSLGTIAWPYSRTFFRDSLAMLFLLCAYYFLELSLSKRTGVFPFRKSISSWMGFSVMLVAGILAKNTIVIALPVIICRLLISIIAAHPKIHVPGILKRIWMPAIVIVLAGIGWLIFIPSLELLGRFTYKYYAYLATFFTTTPHPGLVQAITGPIFSPGKSIFLFSPILFLSLAGLLMRWKSAWFGWLYLILLLIGQGLFYDNGWAGLVNWGLRFTLPAIPLLVLGATPVVEAGIKSVKGRLGLLVLAIVSGFIQLAGVLSPIEKYYVELGNMDPPVSASARIWEPGYSNLLWSIHWLLRGDPLDIAILRMDGRAAWIVAGFGLVILLALINFKAVRTWIVLLTSGLCLGLSIWMLLIYRADPAWYRDRLDLQAAQATISQGYRAGDNVLIKSYGSSIWNYWMNWSDSTIPFSALPYTIPNPNHLATYQQTHNPVDALDSISIEMLYEAFHQNDRIWLVVSSDSPAADKNLEVEWLRRRAGQTQAWTFTNNEQETRLFLFAGFYSDYP